MPRRFTRPALALLLLASVLSGLGLAPRAAEASTEIVLILDNSCSMVTRFDFDGRKVPAADPDRLSVLATLILAQLKDPEDAFHVINFNGEGDPPTFRHLPTDKASIRDMHYDAGTFFLGALTEAKRILDASRHERRLLVFLTDGLPSDVQDPTVLSNLIGSEPSFEVLAIGLSDHSRIRESQEIVLNAIVQDHGRYIQVTDPKELITRFTKAYAAQLGSKPVPDPDKRVGNAVLRPGASTDVHVGKYVREVMVMAASTDRKGPFGAVLARDGAVQPLTDEGDSGCAPPPGVTYVGGWKRSCTAPFNHYKVWKVPNDPARESDWKLSIDSGARSKVVFGFILRYELQAEILAAPSEVRIGEPFEVEGRINYNGKTFDDREFFESDGFEAWLFAGGEKVPLTRGEDSLFRGTVSASQRGEIDLKLVFENRWMHLETRADLLVEGYLPLDLQVSPDPIDFGDWQGSHQREERCRDVDLTGSTNADRIPLELSADVLPEGLGLKVGIPRELPGARLVKLPRGTTRFTLCISSPKCCSDLDESQVQITLRGQDPHYHPTGLQLPLRFRVEKAGWLRCWLLVILTVAAILFALFVLYGYIRPHNFPMEARVKLSGTERGLIRAPARPLRDMPGGKKGFYRNATVGFDVNGQPRKPRKKAYLRLEATSGGEIHVTAASGLETKNPRNRRWEEVDFSSGLVYLRRRVVYRVGELLFRIE